mgnify:FL=1
MIVHTCFNNCSERGYSGTILKSGICKYFRRGEKDKFKWCVMEMSLFHDHPKGSGLITNLINRLKILLMEDLSCKEIYIISKCSEILDEYDKDRSKRYLLLNFCDLVMKGSRNRIVSYVNCWYRDKEFILKDISLDKIKKYKREGDSNELLLLGENLIDKLEKGDESIFQIFNEMMKIKDNNGIRFRRKEAVYLWFEILKDYMWPKQLEKVYDFCLQMFMRKGMKERPAFGIWLGLICLKRDDLDYSEKDYQKLNPEDFNEYREKMIKIEIDDYVINDYHVNKGFGLGKFAEEGAYVKDEEFSLLGDKGSEYKDYYIQMKHKSDPKKKKKKNIKSTSGVLEEEEKRLEKSIKIKLSFDKFTDIRVLQEGVCGGKVPCIEITYQGKKYILKQMGESMNYGKDYLFMDECKDIFDLWSMNMQQIICDKKIVKKDKNIKTFVNNWSFSDEKSIYVIMDYFDNIGDLGKNKDYLKDERILKECMKIRLFDGLFRSSDNILRNILIDKDGELLSIDEGDIYGRRDRIFNHNDWCQKKNISDEILQEVVLDILSDKEKKIILIQEKMIKYGFNHHVNEFKTRFKDYRQIIQSEWK